MGLSSREVGLVGGVSNLVFYAQSTIIVISRGGGGGGGGTPDATLSPRE